MKKIQSAGIALPRTAQQQITGGRRTPAQMPCNPLYPAGANCMPATTQPQQPVTFTQEPIAHAAAENYMVTINGVQL
jgi:hypothetical protein